MGDRLFMHYRRPLVWQTMPDGRTVQAQGLQDQQNDEVTGKYNVGYLKFTPAPTWNPF
jgi:hypothetical protein